MRPRLITRRTPAMHIPRILRPWLSAYVVFDWRSGDTNRVWHWAPDTGATMKTITQVDPWSANEGGRYVELSDADCNIATEAVAESHSFGTIACLFKPLTFAGNNFVFGESSVAYTVLGYTINDVTVQFVRNLKVVGNKSVNASVTAGEWHLYIADWGDAGTRLFLDGRHVDTDSTVGDNDANTLTVRLGNAAGSFGDNQVAFFAMWDQQIGERVNHVLRQTRMRAAA